MLCWAVIANARHFIDHVRARFELEERGEIIQLLREFEASGSGGLWELDSDLILVNISTELAHALGQLGRTKWSACRAPNCSTRTGRASQFSTGMRTLFAHFEAGTPFRDLAIPALDQRALVVAVGQADPRPGRRAARAGAGSDRTSPTCACRATMRCARRGAIR